MSDKAVIYCRVSTTEQSEKWSLAAQARILKEYGKKNGLEIVKEFIATESGYKKEDRKTFQDLVDFIKRQNIRNLLVVNDERLYRNFRDLVVISELFDSGCGFKIHFAESNEILDGNDSDKMMLHELKTSMAKRFIADLRKKTKRGIEQKKLSGEYYGGVPLGYLLKKGKLESDPSHPQ